MPKMFSTDPVIGYSDVIAYFLTQVIGGQRFSEHHSYMYLRMLWVSLQITARQ